MLKKIGKILTFNFSFLNNWLIVAVFFIFTASAYSQDIQVSAEVDSNVIAVGSAGQLTVTVNGVQNTQPVNISPIDGLDIRYLGPSQKISIVNGQYSSSVSFMYSILPLKVGKYEIPSLEITVNNQVYKTSAVSLEVVDQPQANQPANNQNQTINLSDKIFLKLQTPKTDVYLNEKLPIKILLFVNDLNISDIQYPQLETTGFTMSNYDRPKQYSQVVNGLRYDIVEFNAVIYPTRTGDIKLGPAAMESSLIVRNNRQGRNGTLFGDDFLDSFFDRAEKRPISIKSDEAVLHVKDLPAEGKPVNFSGGVGELTFDASVSPTDLKVGDPITLKMSVSGEGNLNAVKLPEFKDNESFKTYDPSIKEENGVKKLEQVVIPKNKDVKEVPAFDFSYFHTGLNKYMTVTKGPFSIHVTEPEGGVAPQVVLSSAQSVKEARVEDKLGQDIVFIKESPGEIYTKGDYFYNQVWFYIVLFLIVLGYGGFFIYYQKTYRLRSDAVYARRFHAPKYAKAGLDLARRCLAEKRSREFYDAVFKTLQMYLSHKFSVAMGEIHFEKVKPYLNGQGSEMILNDLKSIFDECDRVRYSSVPANENEMTMILTRLEKSIEFIERSKT